MGLRKLSRAVARSKMKREGIRHMNRRPWGINISGQMVKYDSFFADHWKEYAGITDAEKAKRKNRRVGTDMAPPAKSDRRKEKTRL